MNKPIDYKSTLNLPKTNFSMKASLSQREPLFLKEWNKEDEYQNIRNKRSKAPLYILHDGPPYANGHIHMGHALNKILKDFVIKYKTLKGFNAPYIPGWDCHGLPIEHQLLKKKKKTIHEADQIEFRKEAKDFALQWVNYQKDEFKRLGILGDWDKPYLTLNYNYEASILEAIQKINQKGHIYKAKKPVYWSIGCETALAEAEVEYADHTSPSIYVKFALKDKPDHYFVIWTTTPWTLPANLAIAVHKDFTYCELKHNHETYIVAKDLAENFTKDCGINDYSLSNEKTGQELEGIICLHPFIERESKIILSEFVTLETGTGCVHTAPGHGQEDYIVGLRYGLQILSPVDEKGRFTKEAQVFEGMPVFKANPLIIDLLKEKNALIHSSELQHSYPHCWRSKLPIIFRATEQWFISVDNHGLRQGCIQNIDQVNWVPSSGQKRISSMVSNRPDWCISRQRLWGVPIPALRCKSCQETFFNDQFIDKLIAKVKTQGIDVWYNNEPSAIAEFNVTCPKCSSDQITQDQNIVDVWFESGVSYQAMLKDYDFHYPADLYLEGSDQHRGWFQSSLMANCAIGEKAPYKEVLTHGFVVDGQGKKMSKSLGNVVDPLQVVKQYGADILRLWVAFSDYSMDIKLSKDHFKQITDAYRKIRNSFRFLLGNLYDYHPVNTEFPYDNLLEIDQWILLKLKNLLKDIEIDMDSYRFYRAFSKIFNFVNNEMSATYFSIQKDTLYCAHPKSHERLSAQKAMSTLLYSLTKVLFPFISFTCYEVFEKIKDKDDINESIFVELWPEIDYPINESEMEKRFDLLFEIRNEAFKKIEDLINEKTIKQSLEAKINVQVSDDQTYNELLTMKHELKRYFIVSCVEISKSSNTNGEKILVDASPQKGVKCNRCWIVFNDRDGEICEQCQQVVDQLKKDNNG